MFVKSDKEILEKLVIALDLPNFYIEQVPVKEQVVFRTSVKRFVQNLVDVKSLTILDRIPKHLLPHFIRGVFDGDGTIYSKYAKGKYRYYYAGFIGYTSFMKFIKENVPIKFSLRNIASKGISRIETYSKEDLLNFYDFMYTNSTIYLNRKHAKFMDMKFIYSTPTTTRETTYMVEDIV